MLLTGRPVQTHDSRVPTAPKAGRALDGVDSRKVGRRGERARDRRNHTCSSDLLLRSSHKYATMTNVTIRRSAFNKSSGVLALMLIMVQPRAPIVSTIESCHRT